MSVIEENWNFWVNFQDIEKTHYQEFQQKINLMSEKLTLILEDGFKVQRFVYNGSIDHNNDDELRMLLERNKHLRHDIDAKLEDLKGQQMKYESYKKGKDSWSLHFT